jgi:hypothetical protein
LLVREADGSYTALDGGHRVELAKLRGDSTITAEVFGGVSESDRAKLFDGRNNRRPVAKYEKDRVSVTARNAQIVAIKNACDATKFIFIAEDDDPSKRTFVERAAAISIMARAERKKGFIGTGEEHLTSVLRIYAAAWGVGENPVKLVLHGISTLLLSLEAEELMLIKALRGVQPFVLEAYAREMKVEWSEPPAKPIGVNAAMVRAITERYNASLAPTDEPDHA